MTAALRAPQPAKRAPVIEVPAPKGTIGLMDSMDSIAGIRSVASPLDRWNAELTLEYARRGSRSAMVRNAHAGPLVVQKALYPEGDDVCQTVILHPPGGIAGGDHLKIDVRAGDGCIAQLTTPGATKWYKANGRDASQEVRLCAQGNAIIEWLPLENIAFDGCVARSSLSLELSSDACAAGWDITAFGRAAAGERFIRGAYRQAIVMRRDGALVWAETGQVNGADPLLESPIGFGGRNVSGLVWVCVPTEPDEATLQACREVGPQGSGSMLCGVTSLPSGVVLARCLADTTEAARHYLTAVWSVLRPMYAKRKAIAPRIWAT